MRRLWLILVALAALTLVAVGGNFVLGWTADGPADRDFTLVVPQGASLPKVAALLAEKGAVKSAAAFANRARLFGDPTGIKAGEFFIPARASNAAIMDILTGGRAVQRLITIPEGMPSVLVHERLMAVKELTGTIPVPGEGSVLPDSYSYERGQTRAAVLMRMQAAMDAALTEEWAKRRPTTVVTSPREALILASIVEKETAKPSERRTVAAVYSNRIRQNMMLQADPTIIYPMTRGKPLGRRIRQSEIAAVNDYNTYAMVGLPKGPIANPSRASIAAVLNPADSKALYFVADGTGGHIFADTLADHNRNVEAWYAIRRQRGEM